MITEKILYKNDNGNPATGLTLNLVYLRRVSNNALVAPLPVISEIGNGWYKFSFANDKNEEYVYQVDCGAVTNISNRYAEGVIEKSVRSMDQFFRTFQAIIKGNRIVTENANGTTTETYLQDNGSTPQISAVITQNGNRTISSEAE